MTKGIRIEIWGDYALFTRPELKTERYSYDVITPSAARGILDSIYYHPGMKWVIDRIHVLSEIKFTNIRRNEVKSKISASGIKSAMDGAQKPLYLNRQDDIQQRAATVLKDVRYCIEAHFELVAEKMSSDDSEDKFYAIAMERLKRGKQYSQPYFGTREFQAYFRPCETIPEQNIHKGERNFGLMLYDMDYSDLQNITPVFYRAVMRDGVIDLHNCEVYR